MRLTQQRQEILFPSNIGYDNVGFTFHGIQFFCFYVQKQNLVLLDFEHTNK